MTKQTYDLLVRAPRLFCADSGLDGPGAVAIRGTALSPPAPASRDRPTPCSTFPTPSSFPA